MRFFTKKAKVRTPSRFVRNLPFCQKSALKFRLLGASLGLTFLEQFTKSEQQSNLIKKSVLACPFEDLIVDLTY